MIISLPLMDSTRNRENIEDVTVGNGTRNHSNIDSLCYLDNLLKNTVSDELFNTETDGFDNESV